MASRTDYSFNRKLYVGTSAEINVADDNAIIQGRVGIGSTSAASAPLDVYGETGDDRIARFESPDDGGYIQIRDNDTLGQVTVKDDVMAMGLGGVYPGTTMLNINTSGNVGIGIKEPPSYAKLQVAGTAGAQTGAFQALYVTSPSTTAGEGVGMRMSAASGTHEAVGIIGMVNNPTGNSGAMTFHTYNAGADIPERMRIDNVGNVGIGTTDPGASKLMVVGSGNYNTIKITNSEAEDTNKQTGICSLNYIGNSTSIMQYATNASANVVYYGSADGAFRGITQHSFYVSTGADTLVHGLGMQITTGKVVVPGKMTIGSTTLPAVPLDVFGGAGGASVRIRGNMSAGLYYYGYMFDGGNVQGTTQSNIFYAEGAVAANTTITDWASFRCLSPSIPADSAITNNYGIYQQSNGQKNFFAGSVGIGTNTPDYKLEVEGTISSCDSALQKATFANVGNDLVLTANADATNVSASLIFKSSGSGGATVSEKMRVASDGSLILGTSTLGGSKRFLMTSADNAVNYDIDFQQTGTTNFGRIRYTEGASDLQFFPITGVAANLTLAFNGNSYFSSRGNLGVGTTDPNQKLQVRTTASTDDSFEGINVHNNATDGARAGICFQGYDWVQSAIWHGRTSTADYTGALVLGTNPDTTDLTVAGVVARMVINNIGRIKFNAYSGSNLTGGASYLLGTDAAGNVVKTLTGATTGTQVHSLPATGGTARWTNFGTFTAAHGGQSICLKIVTNNGYNAGVNQNLEINIRFKTSNGGSVDPNGFSGDSSFYTTGENSAIPAGNIKWVANAAGTLAVSYKLYVLLPQYTGNGGFVVSANSKGTWVNNMSFTTDPGAASSTVMIPIEKFSINGGDFIVNGGGGISTFAGNVTVGATSSPGRVLEVNGGTTQDGGIKLKTSNTASNFWSGIEFSNTFTSSFLFVTANDASGTFKFYPGGSLKATIDGGGTFLGAGDVIAYGSPSDKRLKENIKPIESALDKVMKLEGVTFDWIQKEDQILDIKEDIGFIAQDVKKVIPELVRENENGMLSMRHQGMAPILLEAIKELKAEIDELKKQIK